MRLQLVTTGAPRWGGRRPARFDRNLIVIGGGAAGLVTAYIAAAVKAKVTLVEGHRLGGDCLNTGCVPSKALIRAARAAHDARQAERFGLKPLSPKVDFPAVMARVRGVIAAIEPHDSAERYEGLGVEVLMGRARLVDPWTVEVARNDGGTQRLTARAIVLATGAEPAMPPIPGLDAVGALNSDTLWDAMAGRKRVPGRLVVLGGGPIGCELAQAFARLGSAVTQVEMANRLLPREDPEASAAATAALARDGVAVVTGSRAIACGSDGGGKWIEVEDALGRRRFGFDDILVALGRVARTDGFGLEELGIAADRVIETDGYLQTLHPSIFVAGDAAGPWQFTHVAAHQAFHATMNALFAPVRLRPSYAAIPTVTFTDPEIARVGLTEAEARDRGIGVEVTRTDLADLDRARTEGATEGFVKILTAPGRDRILGATIVGAHAGEMLAEVTLAMTHGIGLKKLLGTVHAYPTHAEAVKAAAGAWRRAQANPAALSLLERFHRWRRG